MALGVASTVILVLYGLLAGSNEELFWSLFAFSGVIFLIPYVAMMFAYLKLRRTEPDRDRPFKIAGPRWLPVLMASVCAFVLCITIILFVYVPGDGVQWPVLGGSVVLLILGEVIVHMNSKKTSKDQ